MEQSWPEPAGRFNANPASRPRPDSDRACERNGVLSYRARQAVDAHDHERLAGMDEIEDGLQFGPSREGGAVAGLGADHSAARSLKPRQLGIEVLVRGRDPGIADAGG